MRVAIVTESFLPYLNGVTTSVCRVVECLRDGGHEVVVIAPRPAPTSYAGYAVHGLASVPVRQFPVGLPLGGEVESLLADFRPDVVHVASPFVLGASALSAADRLDLPTVAVYQTDMPSYLRQHGRGAVGRGAARAAWRWIRRMHELADLTLAPSSATLAELRAHGVPRTALWARGVDAVQFHPGWRLDAGTAALRRSLAPDGQLLVGYVGRLALEKELHRLAGLTGLAGLRVVLVGDGPTREPDAALLAAAGVDAVFLGRREGDDLARAYAAVDLFVHPGTRETFGQTLQEAAATGLPVVAPARGGPLDLVDHSRTGLLFDPDDPGSLREAVVHLAGDGVKRRAMGAAGRAGVEGRSWAALTGQLLGHYDIARATHGSRPSLPDGEREHVG
ncbi:phosphatidylinositol alpha 1,6-mannosyltransferase [Pedococcus dokdonensis]|uniref:D-inositol 3-phosphate glycosyltransferase n=1 Tax=Pedococcus dokdonensis TaxID=443156 RepID=A0A1H0RNL0_9MICO|nr:glycosyltransferase family 1 protein [Pedococcus dokdonensis]SDP31063.1 phosphatidylinositol alpha 1,6-mannosyltransferase [Pedococcus dokdonensis]